MIETKAVLIGVGSFVLAVIFLCIICGGFDSVLFYSNPEAHIKHLEMIKEPDDKLMIEKLYRQRKLV